MGPTGHPQLSRRDWLAATAVLGGAAAVPGQALAHAEITRLSLNENAFGPSPAVAKAITGALPDLARYVDQGEVDALTRRIAVLEGVRPDQIVIGEVLAPLGLHLARRRPGGGTIVYSTPGYTELIDAAVPLGGRGLGVPLNARLENDLPALAAAIDGTTLAVSLVNPHNPSGTVSDCAAFDAFVLAAARRALVVVDEAYLEYADFARLSAVRHVRAGANVLVFRTLAKIYGLAGLPIGYAIAPTALARELRDAGIGAPHSLSRLALVAAGAALGDQARVTRIRCIIASERARVTRLLAERGFRHSDSQANFVYFLPSGSAEQARAAFAAASIEIGRPFPPLQDWLRITIGRPPENDRVIRILASLG